MIQTYQICSIYEILEYPRRILENRKILEEKNIGHLEIKLNNNIVLNPDFVNSYRKAILEGTKDKPFFFGQEVLVDDTYIKTKRTKQAVGVNYKDILYVPEGKYKILTPEIKNNQFNSIYLEYGLDKIIPNKNQVFISNPSDKNYGKTFIILITDEYKRGIATTKTNYPNLLFHTYNRKKTHSILGFYKNDVWRVENEKFRDFFLKDYEIYTLKKGLDEKIKNPGDFMQLTEFIPLN